MAAPTPVPAPSFARSGTGGSGFAFNCQVCTVLLDSLSYVFSSSTVVPNFSATSPWFAFYRKNIFANMLVFVVKEFFLELSEIQPFSFLSSVL